MPFCSSEFQGFIALKFTFPSAYRAHVEGTGRNAAHHPHNEYLLLAVQAGLPAAALFAWLLVRLYGSGARLVGHRRA
ncbi:MAG: hypothetical protein ACKOZZ_04355, partial [Bacteroidota bacterium]